MNFSIDSGSAVETNQLKSSLDTAVFMLAITGRNSFFKFNFLCSFCSVVSLSIIGAYSIRILLSSSISGSTSFTPSTKRIEDFL